MAKKGSGRDGGLLLLTLLFIALKLTGNIDWSWWWVLSPMWICLLIVVLIIAAIKLLD